MPQILANLLWGLRYGAVFAVAFGVGIGLAVITQGAGAFASYHPSVLELLLGGVGLWILGGVVVCFARRFAGSSFGYLVVATFAGVFVASAVLIVVSGFSYFSVGTALLFGFPLGQRVWIARRNSSAV